MHRWWSKKYQAPLNDPRLLSSTNHELLLEFYEDAWEELRVLRGFDALKAPERERLNQLERLLDAQPAVVDSLVDEWDRIIAEGGVPDFGD